jgi:argininosuccinate lyase
MYAADVKGSIAFSKALLKAGILNEHEQQEIARGLKLVEGEWEKGEVGGTGHIPHAHPQLPSLKASSWC